MMRRILMLVVVAALMATMASAALAAPPGSGGATGCEAGQFNAFLAVGAGASEESNAPYRDNPGQGVGPTSGFDNAEDNTLFSSNCR